MLSALRIRKAIRKSRMSRAVVACLIRSSVRLRRLFASSRLIELSMPNLVDACDIGVVGGDNMAIGIVLRKRQCPCYRRRLGLDGFGAPLILPAK